MPILPNADEWKEFRAVLGKLPKEPATDSGSTGDSK
jgi:hypothetical protein